MKPTGDDTWAAVLAQASLELQQQPNSAGVQHCVPEMVLQHVDDADAASLTVVQRRHRVDTPAATQPSALRCAALERETGHGPTLEAVWRAEVVDVADAAHDRRWPEWSDRMAAGSEFRSVHARRLQVGDHLVGALTLYSEHHDAFGRDAHRFVAAFAAHAAVAIETTRRIEELHAAMDGRTVIGQAEGILMERYQIDDASAFATLTRLSSQHNRKLRDIAADLVATRALPQ